MKSPYRQFLLMFALVAALFTLAPFSVHATDPVADSQQPGGNLHAVAAQPSSLMLAQAAPLDGFPPALPLPSTADPNAQGISSNPLQALFDGLLGKYGWITTVILVMGTLRLLLKPIMMAIENAVSNDPEKLAKVREFESGPIFKWISIGLDWGASIKLPATKAVVAKSTK